MPNPQPTQSQNAYFSPQTAFYAPPPTNAGSGMPGMEFLNNPLVSVGFNVVEQGMKDFTGKTVNMLPTEVGFPQLLFCFSFQSIRFDHFQLDEKIDFIDQILFCRRSIVRF